MPARHVVFLFVFIGLVTGCGGSASETPPPLEPDPHALPRPREPAKPESTAPLEGDEALPLREEAPSTWGSGRKRSPTQRETPRAVDAG